jgi:hypothetical protein
MFNPPLFRAISQFTTNDWLDVYPNK